MIDRAAEQEAREIIEWWRTNSAHLTYSELARNITTALQRRDDELARREFIGHDHPTANSRVPIPGDLEWTFSFTLQDGSACKVRVGESGFRAFEKMFIENRDADYRRT